MSRTFAIPTSQLDSLTNLDGVFEVVDNQTYNFPNGTEVSFIKSLEKTYVQPLPENIRNVIALSLDTLTFNTVSALVLDTTTLSAYRLRYGSAGRVYIYIKDGAFAFAFDLEQTSSTVGFLTTVGGVKVNILSEVTLKSAGGVYNAGTWNASSGSFPALRNNGGSVLLGDYFRVSVAGTIGGTNYTVDQTIIATQNNPSTVNRLLWRAVRVADATDLASLPTLRWPAIFDSFAEFVEYQNGPNPLSDGQRVLITANENEEGIITLGVVAGVTLNAIVPIGNVTASTIPVLADFVDGMDQEPATIGFDVSDAGVLTLDFDSSATPPAKGAGNINSTTINADAGFVEIEVDLTNYYGFTGYLHVTLTADGKDSNPVTSQQISPVSP